MKQKSMLLNLFLINGLHLVFCLIIYLMRFLKIDVTGLIVSIFFIAVEVVLWIVCGFLHGLGAKSRDKKNAFTYALCSILPITIITCAGALTGYLNNPETANWGGFFFIGAAINFFNRPAVILSYIIKNSAYLIFAVNIIILFVSSLFGASTGLSMNKKKIRRKKKSAQSKSSPPRPKPAPQPASQKDKVKSDAAEKEAADTVSQDQQKPDENKGITNAPKTVHESEISKSSQISEADTKNARTKPRISSEPQAIDMRPDPIPSDDADTDLNQNQSSQKNTPNNKMSSVPEMTPPPRIEKDIVKEDTLEDDDPNQTVPISSVREHLKKLSDKEESNNTDTSQVDDIKDNSEDEPEQYSMFDAMDGE